MFLLCVLSLSGLKAQTGQPGSFRFGFQVFTDYYHTFQHYDAKLKDSSGFDLSRMNFTAEYSIDSVYDTRIRFESEDRVSILNNSVLAAFIKDLWLRYRFGTDKKNEIIFGIQQTPNYRISEQNWGYRSIERMQMDFERVLGTRDFGIMMRVFPFPAMPLRVSAFFANNSSVARETDIRKRLYFSADFEQRSGFEATLAGDIQALPDDGNGTTVSFYAGYKTPVWRLGGEVFYHQRKWEQLPDRYFRGFSLFGNYSFYPVLDFLLRYDIAGKNFPVFFGSTLLITGIDYHPNESVHIIPNITIQNEFFQPSATVIAKLTVNWEL